MSQVRRSGVVVGGAGYVGSVIALSAAKQGMNITVVDSLLWGQDYVLPELSRNSNVTFVQANMADTERWLKPENEYDFVILAAALVGDPITKSYPELAQQVNEIDIQSVIQDLIHTKVPRIVFLSTCSNYGVVEAGGLAREDSPLKPASLYARQKVAAETLVLSRCVDSNTIPTILRLSTAFGHSPRMRFDLTVPHFVRDAWSTARLEVFDPDTWRPYCHVEDIAQAVLRVCGAPSSVVGFETFNVGGPHSNFSKRQIAELIKAAYPSTQVTYVEGGDDPRDYRVSFEKIQTQLEYSPSWSVENYVSSLAQSLRLGAYPDVVDDPNRYGNYFLG